MAGAGSAGCVFCRIVAGAEPSWTIHETGYAVAFLDRSPATRGHTLVVPRRHARDIWSISRASAARLMEAVHDTAAILESRLDCDGLTLFQANREAAWQEVFHLHVHLIPRYSGDQLRKSWHPRSVTEADLDEIRSLLVLSVEASRLDVPGLSCRAVTGPGWRR